MKQDPKIDLADFDLHSVPPKQMLFDYFQDPDVTQAFQVWIYRRGWRLTPIEEKK